MRFLSKCVYSKAYYRAAVLCNLAPRVAGAGRVVAVPVAVVADPVPVAVHVVTVPTIVPSADPTETITGFRRFK